MRRFAPIFLLPLLACSDTAKDEACLRLESTWAVQDMPEGPTTQAPGPADVSGSSKLSVAVYHFNVQYVAGGLQGFPDGEYVAKYDLDEAEVEDRIVQEGLHPVLDLFLAHPSYKADIELQAYMVEVIALRHPEVLDKMRTLAGRGQIDFDSFHYSDQLYVAYPARDLEVSLDLTKQVFARAGLPLGRSIFTQEGQFARGQLPIADRRGYEVSILPKNLFRYQFGDEAAQASVLYSDRLAPEHAVLLGGQGWTGADGQGQPFELRWTFMDDGEIAFSQNKLNPYFGLDYLADPARLAEHAAELAQMEAEGFVHVTVAEAARAMQARGIPATPLPPVLDGTWQPKDTGNVYRWMGGPGIFRTQESDGDTLATIWRARTAVARAADQLGEQVEEAVRQGLTAAWREALLAQVSDSTGWNPFVGEIRYSRDRSANAEAIVQDVLLCAGLEPASGALELECTDSSATPDALGVTLAIPAREVQTRMETCTGFEGVTVHRLTLEAAKVAAVDELLDPSEEAARQRELGLEFAYDDRDFSVLEAFREGPVTHDLADYTFEWIGIPLPSGLIGLGGDRWVVQDQASARVAALIGTSTETRGRVTMRDMTVPRAASSTRHFYLLEGASADQATRFAGEVNFH